MNSPTMTTRSGIHLRQTIRCCLRLGAAAVGLALLGWLTLNDDLAAQEVELPGGGKLIMHPDINAVEYPLGDRTISIYRGSKPGRLLLTDGRRDLIAPVLEAAARGEAVPSITAPASATYWLQKPHEYWQSMIEGRFHDYAQQTTKVPAAPLDVDVWAESDDRVEINDKLSMWTIATPGYSRSAITYVLQTVDNKRVAFTGDLIYGDGKILDLYSFQDAIPDAQIRGYHGYGSRLAELVKSLDQLAGLNVDLIVPARGPVIKQPDVAIANLKRRVQALYGNYLSTNALHWYFKEERMRTCGERVLGKDAKIELMPYCEHKETPDWIYENSTSRLIISESGHGFLLDCGYQRVIDAIRDLQKDNVVKDVEGLFVTHYHDDHTDQVQNAAETFDCPVYATKEYADLLSNPDGYHLPAMTANPIDVTTLDSGHKMRWREFELTFYFFPGQTYYHGALLVKKPNADPILFVGDAFAPSGMDDYCVLNRNLLGEDQGFLKCLKQVQETEGAWLINEHIRHIFRFNTKEMEYLFARYRERIELQGELFVGDSPNYGVDEQWAFFYPYASRVKPGEETKLKFRIWNHSPKKRTYSIRPQSHNGAKPLSRGNRITLEPNQRGEIVVAVASPDEKPKHGVALITADVTISEIDGSRPVTLKQWAEAMLIVE